MSALSLNQLQKNILLDNSPLNEKVQVFTDKDPTHPVSTMSWGTLTWFIIKRGDKYGVRVKDSNSEVLRNFQGIPSFEIDLKYRLEGTFVPFDVPQKHEMMSKIGTVEEETSYGAIEFELDGKKYSLIAFNDISKPLWILFRDETSGVETYGAGRYLYTDGIVSDNKVIIDFNMAYNPPCCFTSFATCSLPPQENWLDIGIYVGEKTIDNHG